MTRKKKLYWLTAVTVMLFIPLPTELVPEWRMQFKDEAGRPLSRVRVNQSWNSYTYFAVGGYDEQCTDLNGVAAFPKRFLWSSVIGRIVSPLLAEALKLTHGGSGTVALIHVFDQHYFSDYYYWRNGVSSNVPDLLPTEGMAHQVNNVDRGIKPCD